MHRHTKTVTVSLPPELLAEAQKFSILTGRTFSGFVTFALRKAMEADRER